MREKSLDDAHSYGWRESLDGSEICPKSKLRRSVGENVNGDTRDLPCEDLDGHVAVH